MSTAQRIIKYCAIAFAIFLIVSIVSGIMGAVSCLSFFFDSGDAVGEKKTYAITEDIDSLEIEVGGAQLEVRTGRDFSVESNHRYLEVETVDGMLRIREDRADLGFYSDGAQIILTVPEGAAFDHADISVGAGLVNISVDELTDLNLNMGAGEVDLESSLTGACVIDCGVGELNMTLAGTAEDYRISLDKGLGQATLDGVKMADDAVYGNGKNSIDIDGGVGDIEIAFARTFSAKDMDFYDTMR